LMWFTPNILEVKMVITPVVHARAWSNASVVPCFSPCCVRLYRVIEQFDDKRDRGIFKCCIMQLQPINSCCEILSWLVTTRLMSFSLPGSHLRNDSNELWKSLSIFTKNSRTAFIPFIEILVNELVVLASRRTLLYTEPLDVCRWSQITFKVRPEAYLCIHETRINCWAGSLQLHLLKHGVSE
jgi:hypothetical protein